MYFFRYILANDNMLNLIKDYFITIDDDFSIIEVCDSSNEAIEFIELLLKKHCEIYNENDIYHLI